MFPICLGYWCQSSFDTCLPFVPTKSPTGLLSFRILVHPVVSPVPSLLLSCYCHLCTYCYSLGGVFVMPKMSRFMLAHSVWGLRCPMISLLVSWGVLLLWAGRKSFGSHPFVGQVLLVSCLPLAELGWRLSSIVSPSLSDCLFVLVRLLIADCLHILLFLLRTTWVVYVCAFCLGSTLV